MAIGNEKDLRLALTIGTINFVAGMLSCKSAHLQSTWGIPSCESFSSELHSVWGTTRRIRLELRA